MTEAARIDGGPAAYRGFLFSDLRGFTAYAEKFGNAAAATKVNAFLEIARRAIKRHDGAEMMTEGDAIHAVFPSASSAVLCGLEIVDATAELNEQQPQRAIGVGVGVHAGEAVETAEGYIGRAVNIAARLCAAAKPGEVLVSSTVKGITQASIPVGFIPRGRRRLKGIADPIVVYAVTRDMSAKAARQVPRTALVGAAAVVVVAAIGVAMLAGAQLLPKQAASPGTSAVATPAAQPIAIGPLSIGAYASQEFQPPLTLRIVDQGWTANRDLAGMLGLIREVPPRGSVYFLRVDEVIANPCIDGGDGTETGPTAPDVLAALEALDHLDVSSRLPVEIGGRPAQQVDVTVSDGVLAACGGLVGSEAAVFRAGTDVWSAASGERFRVISAGVGDTTVTIVLSTDWTQTPSVQELEDLLQLGQRVLDSVEF